MITGIGGGVRRGCVALVEGGRVAAACPQQRVTRVRANRGEDDGAPLEALDLLLARAGRARGDLERGVLVDTRDDVPGVRHVARLEHHLAHACTAYLTSPFASAAIVICDHEAPEVTVWRGDGARVSRVEWPWEGPGFARIASVAAQALGLTAEASAPKMEALGRLRPGRRDAALDALLAFEGDRLAIAPALAAAIEARAGGPDGPLADRAVVAAALYARQAELLVAMLDDVRRRTGETRLCLGGTLFNHSAINSAVRQSGLFADVFVPVDPGNTGIAVGAALHGSGAAPATVSPFLGPSYSPQEIKETLDNCKLHYAWESADGAVAAAVRALRAGRLVAWFDGGMEWGPRALGARCILADPFSPYALENLNRFLKHRDPWRGYSLSGLAGAVAEHFDGPTTSPYMECDYQPRDPGRFRHALPEPGASVRVHTVDAAAPARFRQLLDAMGEATGLPFVINTSFNGFHEPIVCSPRDAVRVFYGTGVDVLVLEQFVLQK